MKKVPLYSHAPRARAAEPPSPPSVTSLSAPAAPAAEPTARITPTRAGSARATHARSPVAAVAVAPAAAGPSRTRRLQHWFTQHQSQMLWGTVAVLLVFCGALASQRLQPAAPSITQKHIDAAVRKTMETHVMPSPYTRALAAIAPSVVRVQGLPDDEADDGDPLADAPDNRPANKLAKKDDKAGKGKAEPPAAESNQEARIPQSTGTGVVIVDDGTILTNLHVVIGQKRLRVTFADGMESEATLVSAEPQHDLAVLRADDIPDDLKAATMRSTADLMPGDQVVAVGFPFGIGPSVSGGVVSGLKREFRAPGGQRTLSDLIQFDAAANPGNSGGPLVTMDGAVVGIVTAILNPSEQRTFIGIGFAVPIEAAAGAAGMPPF